MKGVHFLPSISIVFALFFYFYTQLSKNNGVGIKCRLVDVFCSHKITDKLHIHVIIRSMYIKNKRREKKSSSQAIIIFNMNI